MSRAVARRKPVTGKKPRVAASKPKPQSKGKGRVRDAATVSVEAAIDEAFSTADRVTLAGSMMPALTMSTYSPVRTS